MIDDFLIEANEMFELAEIALLNIDKGEEFDVNFNQVFRSFHNLKGAAGMFNMDLLQDHMHKVETLFESTREKGSISKIEIDFFLDSIDAAREILDGNETTFKVVSSLSELESKDEKSHEKKIEKAKKSKEHVDSKIQPLIFVVDDEPDIVDILKFGLESEGYSVNGYTSGEELLKNLDLEPDLILSDIKMPEVDGIKLLKEVHELTPEIPFIFFSGFITKEVMLEALPLGAQGFLEKPIDLDYVKSISKLAINRYRAKKLLDKSVDYILYQFSDLDKYLEKTGQISIRNSLKIELENILEQKRIMKQTL